MSITILSDDIDDIHLFAEHAYWVQALSPLAQNGQIRETIVAQSPPPIGPESASNRRLAESLPVEAGARNGRTEAGVRLGTTVGVAVAILTSKSV